MTADAANLLGIRLPGIRCYFFRDKVDTRRQVGDPLLAGFVRRRVRIIAVQEAVLIEIEIDRNTG